jgi:hypothetical protein
MNGGPTKEQIEEHYRERRAKRFQELLTEKCIHCQHYWVSRGRCRRFPPASIVSKHDTADGWPRVRSENTCGEFTRMVTKDGRLCGQA